MSIFLIPEHIRVDVRLSVDSGLLTLLQAIVDQASDRAEAAKLSTEARAATEAMKAAIPSP